MPTVSAPVDRIESEVNDARYAVVPILRHPYGACLKGRAPVYVTAVDNPAAERQNAAPKLVSVLRALYPFFLRFLVVVG